MNNCYTYFNKSDALKQLEKLNNTEYKLFSADTKNPDNPGGKRFFITSYNYIYKLIIDDDENKYCYENYNDSQKIKLFFDIDYNIDTKINSDGDCDYDSIDDIDTEAQQVLGRALYDIEQLLNVININMENQTFIICDSNRSDKISYHIVFPNIIFDNVISIKNLIKNNISDKNTFIDTSVYGNGCLRCLFCSKFQKKNELKLYDSHKYDFIDNKQLFFDTLVTNIDDDIIPFSYSKSNTKKYNNIDNICDIDIDIDVDKLKEYIDIINNKRFDNYDECLE